MNRSLPVAIFDASSPPALAFTRALGRAGIQVHIYSHNRLPAARLSRFAYSFHRSPDINDANRFIPWLEAEVHSGRIQLVAPTSDMVAFYLGEILATSPEAMRKAVPNHEAILTALMKDRFDETCSNLGIRTPKAIYPNSVEEVANFAGSLTYPVITKPRSHIGLAIERGEVIENEEELRARYRPYTIPPECSSIFERYPALRWPMVQEYIPGALTNLYSISGMIAPDGTTLAGAGSRKMAQWPPRLGIGTIFEPYQEPNLIARGLDIARKIIGHGIFELELIYDPRTADYVAIDLNPRAYGQINFEIARGMNLPLLWYKCATGAAAWTSPPTVQDMICIHGLHFHLGQLTGIVRGPKRLKQIAEYRARLSRCHVDIANDLRDPLPSIVLNASILRHPGGLIRPFLGHGYQ